jgi:hypothetical protein
MHTHGRYAVESGRVALDIPNWTPELNACSRPLALRKSLPIVVSMVPYMYRYVAGYEAMVVLVAVSGKVAKYAVVVM